MPSILSTKFGFAVFLALGLFGLAAIYLFVGSIIPPNAVL